MLVKIYNKNQLFPIKFDAGEQKNGILVNHGF